MKRNVSNSAIKIKNKFSFVRRVSVTDHYACPSWYSHVWDYRASAVVVARLSLLWSARDDRRESGTQTKKDGTSSLPQPKVFLAGLRGGGMSEPTVMTKVDLTIDVDGTWATESQINQQPTEPIVCLWHVLAFMIKVVLWLGCILFKKKLIFCSRHQWGCYCYPDCLSQLVRFIRQANLS